MTEKGWTPVNPKNLQTRFDCVYAIGDVTSVGSLRAGVFVEAAERVVAESQIARISDGDQPAN